MQLEEIADGNSIILVDGSINLGGGNLSWEIYQHRIYRNISCNLLKKGEESLNHFIKVLENPLTRTIPEVTKEIKQLEKILSDKIKFLSQNKERRGRRKRDGREAEKLLKKLQAKAWRIYGLSKRNEIQIEGREYDSLLEMVKIIDRAGRLKQDTSYNTYGTHEEDMSGKSDTDERLTAVIYYLSLFSDKKPVLLTRDTDFERLLPVVVKLIGADNFSPYNQEFREAVKSRNPFNLYMGIGNREYNLALNSQKIDFDKEFKLHLEDKEKSQETKQKIAREWLKFQGLFQSLTPIKSN